MIKTELQKLLHAICPGIKDEQFLNDIRKVFKSGVVYMPSLALKLTDIKNNLKNLDHAADICTEIKAASQFSGVLGLTSISFGENPDIKLKIGSYKLSVEVKRFRYRYEDEVDTQILKNYNGIARPYGNPELVQSQIELVLLKKAIKYTGEDPFFIYLWSDSPLQVENCEIHCATRSVGELIGGKLLGVFYKFNAHPKNLILVESSPLTNDIRKLLESTFNVLT